MPNIPAPNGRLKIYLEITDERLRQDAKWGGAEHDDGHSLHDWLDQIEYQHEQAWYNEEPRTRLVKIAALAVAALESLDRKAEAAKVGPSAGAERLPRPLSGAQGSA